MKVTVLDNARSENYTQSNHWWSLNPGELVGAYLVKRQENLEGMSQSGKRREEEKFGLMSY